MVIRTHYNVGQTVYVQRIKGTQQVDGKMRLTTAWKVGRIHQIGIKIDQFHPLGHIVYTIRDLKNTQDRITIGQNEMHKLKPYFKMESHDELSTHVG